MDVVEAIDAWIDEQIDDLSDDELERTLEILDVVAASPLADVDADDIDAADIDEIVGLAGGSAASRSHTAQVLRAALSDEWIAFPRPLDTDGLDPQVTLPTSPGEDNLFSAFDDEPAGRQLFDATAVDEADLIETEDDDLSSLFVADDIDDDEQPDNWDDEEELDDASNSDDSHHDLDGDDGDDEDDEGHADGDLGVSTSGPDTLVTDDDFLNDLARAERTDEVAAITVGLQDRSAASPSDVRARRQPVPQWAKNVRPVPLRDHDVLGPSFLPEKADVATSRRGLRYFVLPVFMVLGLATFAFGMLQLVNSLEDEPTDTATTESVRAATASDTEPKASPEPSEVPATPAPADAAAAAPTSAPEPPPHPGFAIRLVSGDVIVADYAVLGEPPTLTKVYDATDDDHSPARALEWGTIGLAVVNNEGDVLLLDLDAPQSPRLIFEANEEIGEAVEVAIVPDYVAVRTDLGNIAIVESAAGADPDDIDVVWDAAEQGAAVTDISSIDEMVPFVLDTGDARMIDTASDNSIITIWVANGQAPVFNVEGSPAGILLGVGQGAIARYRLGDVDGDRFEAVWDPFGTNEEPAIGYSGVGNRTAIILADGAIVLADETGSGPRLWEPADTEIRAFIAAGSETQIIVLLENGSVVRIPVGSDELIESVWDITDETLSAANQIVLEPVG